jgi:HEAT repeat protein
MGLLDFLRHKSDGPRISSAVQRQIKKLTNKHVDSQVRMFAAQELAEEGSPDAIRALLKRFRFMIHSSIQDQEEKQFVHDLLLDLGEAAVEPLLDYIHNEDEIVWALGALQKIVEPDAFRDALLSVLERFRTADHVRFPEKCAVVIEHLAPFVEEKVANALRPFLEDDDDDVRLAAIAALSHKEYRDLVREDFLRVMRECDDRPRVLRGFAEALVELQWPVKGYRSAIEQILPEDFHIVRKGTLKRRAPR